MECDKSFDSVFELHKSPSKNRAYGLLQIELSKVFHLFFNYQMFKNFCIIGRQNKSFTAYVYSIIDFTFIGIGNNYCDIIEEEDLICIFLFIVSYLWASPSWWLIQLF